MGVVLIVMQCSGQSCIRKIDNTIPGVDIAPYEITTPTHLYYAERVEENKETVIMHGWYEYADKKWIKRDLPMSLDRVLYHNKIKVKDRR